MHRCVSLKTYRSPDAALCDIQDLLKKSVFEKKQWEEYGEWAEGGGSC